MIYKHDFTYLDSFSDEQWKVISVFAKKLFEKGYSNPDLDIKVVDTKGGFPKVSPSVISFQSTSCDDKFVIKKNGYLFKTKSFSLSTVDSSFSLAVGSLLVFIARKFPEQLAYEPEVDDISWQISRCLIDVAMNGDL